MHTNFWNHNRDENQNLNDLCALSQSHFRFFHVIYFCRSGTKWNVSLQNGIMFLNGSQWENYILSRNTVLCFKTTRITTQSTIIAVGICNVLHLFSVLSVGNNVHRNIAHAFPLLCSSSWYVVVTHLQPRLRKYDRHANLLRTGFSKLIRTPAPAF